MFSFGSALQHGHSMPRPTKVERKCIELAKKRLRSMIIGELQPPEEKVAAASATGMLKETGFTRKKGNSSSTAYLGDSESRDGEWILSSQKGRGIEGRTARHILPASTPSLHPSSILSSLQMRLMSISRGRSRWH